MNSTNPVLLTRCKLSHVSNPLRLLRVMRCAGNIRPLTPPALVAGAWTERKKMYHGGSFLKLADDNMDIQNPEAQNRELSGF